MFFSYTEIKKMPLHSESKSSAIYPKKAMTSIAAIELIY
jgi:hypothetical protein